MDIFHLGKKKSGQVEDGSPDPNHPPVPTTGFAKYVGKLHKSDDRGFMIQYNVRIILVQVFANCFYQDLRQV